MINSQRAETKEPVLGLEAKKYFLRPCNLRWKHRWGTDRVWVESRRAALRLAEKEKRRGAAASLPLAARVSILNEIGTVLINGIISQVHADIILGKRQKSVGLGGRAALPLPLCALPGHWGLEMEEKGVGPRAYLNWQNRGSKKGYPIAWSIRNSNSP